MIIRAALPSIVFEWSELANHLLESMEPAETSRQRANLKCLDYVTQRNYGLEHQSPVGVPVNLQYPNESSRDSDHIA